MQYNRRSLSAVAAAAAVALTVAGCGGGGGETAAAPAAEGGVELVNEGQLTWCTSLPYEPFEYQEPGSTEVVGFDVDLINLIAERVGATASMVDTPFEGIQSGTDLTIGTCDVAAAGMTINDVREENFDFSDPYFDANQVLLVPEGSPIQGAEQLAGQRVGVQNATTGLDYATANFTQSELVVFDDLGLLTTAIQTGDVAAIINDNGVLLDFAQQNPGYAVTAEFETGEQYGFGVRTGNTALVEVINEVIETSRTDGSYDEIYQRWFPEAPAN